MEQTETPQDEGDTLSDYELVAEVFDGGFGDRPLLREALEAFTRMERVFGRDFAHRLITNWIEIKRG